MKSTHTLLASILAILLVVQPVFAFLYEIPVLSREEIQKLSTEDLTEKYIEAKIEERASHEFHIGAGYNSAKEYKNRKKLLRFIFELRRELARREAADANALDEFLK